MHSTIYFDFLFFKDNLRQQQHHCRECRGFESTTTVQGRNEVYGIRDQQPFWGWDQGSQFRDLGSQPVISGSGMRDQNSQCFLDQGSKCRAKIRDQL